MLRLDPEREKPKRHYFGPSSTSTPQRQTEARALPPDFGSPQMESFLLKEQELKRQEIQQQLANIQSLNKTINLEIGGSGHGSLEDDREIDDMRNVICSTDPLAWALGQQLCHQAQDYENCAGESEQGLGYEK